MKKHFERFERHCKRAQEEEKEHSDAAGKIYYQKQQETEGTDEYIDA